MENQENPELLETYSWFLMDENSKILEISQESFLAKRNCVVMAKKRIKHLMAGPVHSFITDGQIQNITYDIKVELIKTPSNMELISEIYCYIIHKEYKKIKSELHLIDESKENEYIQNCAMLCHNNKDIYHAIINYFFLIRMLCNLNTFDIAAVLGEFLKEQDPVEALQNNPPKKYFEYRMFD